MMSTFQLLYRGKPKAGFTLIELSIVLVIIGLVVGGIVAGKEMIEQAQMRQIIADIRTIESQIITFKDRFKQLPGDFDRASEMFGSPPCIEGQGVDAYDTNCDGDGDDAILARTIGVGREDINVFHHLSLAGILKEGYRGGVMNDSITAGVHSPKNGFGGYRVVHITYGAYTYGNTIMITPPIANNTDSHISNYTLSPSKAYLLDLKIDDGTRFRGKMVGNGPGSGVHEYLYCSSNSTWNGLNYPISDAQICRIHYFIDRNQ